MTIAVAESVLRTFAEGVLEKAGLDASDGRTVADSLLFANLRGIDSHGIIRLPSYVRRLEVGGTRISPDIRVVKEAPALVLLDGDNGMGQVVGMRAAEIAVDKARKVGSSFVGVLRSSHNGAVSYYAMSIANAGMIGVSTSNTTPVMAAWGGAESVIGNNPLSIAVPFREGEPLVFDAAMSKVAGGKVRLAAANGTSIPEGWILNRDGRPTSDPNDILDGTLLPFGEHKGFGLAVMIEILSAVLTGAGMLHQNPFWAVETETPLSIGHSFMAIDIERFMALDEFRKRMEWMVGVLKVSPTSNGEEEIIMPGQIEAKIARNRRRDGIPISDEVWDELQALGHRYGEPLAAVSS
jgi:LDH2 family malate/lactate/ureidoglycolate dehydrogenase